MLVISGSGQDGTVGEELEDALVVRVTDDADRPVGNQLVNWRVTAGGGSLFAGSALTDGEGIARERWTLGTVAGAPQSVEARAVDNQSGEGLVFATFTATAKAGSVASLTATGGAQEGTAGQPLATEMVARAADQYGNAVAGALVTWEPSGDGEASPTTSTTDAAGAARTTWTLGTAAGTQRLVARIGSLAMATFTATAKAGGATRLEIVSGNERDGVAGLDLSEVLVARAVDALDNPAGGATVTWLVRSGNGSAMPATSSTNSDGIAQTTWRLGTTAGVQTLAARLGSGSEVTFTARAIAGPVAALTVLEGDGQRAKVGTVLGLELVVKATDQYGNVVPDTEVAWSVTADAGVVSPSVARTGDDGITRGTWTLGARSGEVTATASAGGRSAGFAAYAEPAGATRLERVQASGGTVGERANQAFIVRAVDAWGTPVRGVTIAFAASHDGSFSPASAVTGTDGRASSELRLGTVAGVQRATIAADGTEPLYIDVTATPGIAMSAEIVSGDGQVGPVAQELPLPLVARARDAYGNVTSPDFIAWTVVEGGGTLSVAARNYATGENSVRWTVGVAGTGNRVRAGVGTGGEVFFRATGTEVAARTLVAQMSATGTAPVYTPLTPRVRLVDGSGAPVAGASISWTAMAPAGATLEPPQPATSVTDADGYASTSWRLSRKIGDNVLVATAPDAPAVTIARRGTALDACFIGARNVAPWTGGQPVRINDVLTGIRGFARDPFSNPVAGVDVLGTNRAPGSTIGNSPTDETGLTPVAQYQVGTTAGERISNWFESICTGEWPVFGSRGQNVSFTIYVLPDPPATMFAWQGDGMSVPVGRKFILRVMVQDQYGNRVPNIEVAWQVESGGGSLISGTSVTEGGSEHFNPTRSEHANYGSAYNEWTLGPVVGEQRVTATIAGGFTFTFKATATAP